MFENHASPRFISQDFPRLITTYLLGSAISDKDMSLCKDYVKSNIPINTVNKIAIPMALYLRQNAIVVTPYMKAVIRSNLRILMSDLYQNDGFKSATYYTGRTILILKSNTYSLWQVDEE